MKWCPLKRRAGNQVGWIITLQLLSGRVVLGNAAHRVANYCTWWLLCAVQVVSGELLISVEWQFTREGLLQREVELLDRMLAEKVELLARLRPVGAGQAASWVKIGPVGTKPTKEEASSDPGGTDNARMAMGPYTPAPGPAPHTSHERLHPHVQHGHGHEGHTTAAGGGHGPGGHGVHTSDELLLDGSDLPLQNAQQISESYFINLDVHVLEVGLCSFQQVLLLCAVFSVNQQTQVPVPTSYMSQSCANGCYAHAS
jgi:hypothetical protein